ncbi:MAG: cupin domain-containing protein [Acidobacteriota bacterium]|nr:cupin domain-containing protein [Acidobacteriota bacterium]MDH3786649.1 cupin domain-containing protein [Acidobacteriota bacterium]
MSHDSGHAVKKASDVDATVVGAGTATTTQTLLGAADGAPHFAMRRFSMGDGGGMPLHTNTVEHEQYVLRGRARVTIGTESFEVSEGTVVFIPAGVPHDYTVLDAPFEFLCMVPNLPDNIQIVER